MKKTVRSQFVSAGIWNTRTYSRYSSFSKTMTRKNKLDVSNSGLHLPRIFYQENDRQLPWRKRLNQKTAVELITSRLKGIPIVNPVEQESKGVNKPSRRQPCLVFLDFLSFIIYQKKRTRSYQQPGNGLQTSSCSKRCPHGLHSFSKSGIVLHSCLHISSHGLRINSLPKAGFLSRINMIKTREKEAFSSITLWKIWSQVHDECCICFQDFSSVSRN